MTRGFDLSAYGISALDVLRDPSLGLLYEDGVVCDGEWITSSGALATNSGDRTARSPRDKRIVEHPESQDDIDWGSVNIKLPEKSFESLRRQANEYFNTCGRLYLVDGYTGGDASRRIKIRVICARPYHALFMRNMLIRPTASELANFGKPDFVIYNAGPSPANPKTPGLGSATSVSISFERGEVVILGTEYAGEVQRVVFTLMNYLMPRQDVLSMRCAANESAAGDVSLFFGLSGAGKTTLSADPGRKLIGDDQHCWTDKGVFNIEAGCYTKCHRHSPEKQSELNQAVRFGAILENVVVDPITREIDYHDDSLTENTRICFPNEFLSRSKVPGEGTHPTNLILLCSDAFGVLPPVSRLTPEQAIYHFLSGYCAKLVKTEEGALEPKARFSACFGEEFLVWQPTKYAELLAKRLRSHKTQAWLVNTGWTGGVYSTGTRIKLEHTQAIIAAIHSGELLQAATTPDPIFGLSVPKQVSGVPQEILLPLDAWKDRAAYAQTAARLAEQFQKHFETFAAAVDPAVRQAGPSFKAPAKA